jgi:conjugal transfer pilus assembly protein TraV
MKLLGRVVTINVGWIFTLIAMGLSGCTQMNTEFECPMKPGVRCESIDSVNERINRGEIGSHGVNASGVSSLQKTSANVSLSENHNTINSMQNWKDNDFNKGEPLRYGETVMRVWISPFEDREGNYHQESTIYSVIKPGSWIGVPVKEITEES